MVKQIQCYEDASGKLHRDPFAAHRADLAIWFAKSGDVSETSAAKLADWIISTPEMTDVLIEMLNAIDETRPPPPERVAPMDEAA